MAKPLDPKAIEAERQTSSRAERREQKRRQMQDEISYNQRGNGVIIIPPQKRRELAEEPPKLRVAAYCRVSTQEVLYALGDFFIGRIEKSPKVCIFSAKGGRSHEEKRENHSTLRTPQPRR